MPASPREGARACGGDQVPTGLTHAHSSPVTASTRRAACGGGAPRPAEPAQANSLGSRGQQALRRQWLRDDLSAPSGRARHRPASCAPSWSSRCVAAARDLPKPRAMHAPPTKQARTVPRTHMGAGPRHQRSPSPASGGPSSSLTRVHQRSIGWCRGEGRRYRERQQTAPDCVAHRRYLRVSTHAQIRFDEDHAAVAAYRRLDTLALGEL